MRTDCLQDKVIIRLADPSDLPDIFLLVDAYDGPVAHDKKITKNNLREIVYSKGVFLGVYNDKVIGGVAGFIYPSLFNEEFNYNAMFLFILPEYRRFTKAFITEIELALLGTRATKLTFGFPSNEPKMNRFIRMLGYKELETHYQKRFS